MALVSDCSSFPGLRTTAIVNFSLIPLKGQVVYAVVALKILSKKVVFTGKVPVLVNLWADTLALIFSLALSDVVCPWS